MLRSLALFALAVSLAACGSDDAPRPEAEAPAEVVAPAAELSVSAPFTAAAPAGRTGGVFMTVAGGAEPDTLLAARSAVAERVEVHETYDTEDGLLGMREVSAGIAVAAGETVALAPGGYHIMLMNLSRELALGDTVDLELDFARAGAVAVRVPVQSLDAMPAPSAE